MTGMGQGSFYSVRRLSPYEGTVQVVTLPGFRALSDDGVTWRIQSLDPRSRSSSYGVWREDGSGTLIDTDRTHALVETLRAHPALPFPLADRLELWLLDAHGAAPLAILKSTLDERPPPRATEARWQAALKGEQHFTAASLASGGRGGSFVPHTEVLNRLVRSAAGPQPRAQWFRRSENGDGTGLHGLGLDPAWVGRALPRNAFPELLLRETWERASDRDLVRDYHDFHAASLLTHDNIARATRARLEQAACRQSARLYHLRHVLPEVVDTERLKVAMVEAVIRRSASTT